MVFGPNKMITEQQYADALARLNKNQVRQGGVDPVEKESKLHEDIIACCKARGWICFHGSMTHRTHRTVGECDFTCLLPDGVVVFIECKSKNSKLRPEQAAIQAWMKKLGHILFVVRNMDEFYSACQMSKNSGHTIAGERCE